jgi:hypothetical protein
LGKVAGQIAVAADFEITERIPAAIGGRFAGRVGVQILFHPSDAPRNGSGGAVVVGAGRKFCLGGREGSDRGQA